MRHFKTILSVLALSLAAGLVACGGGSSNTPPPPPPAISVAVSSPPPVTVNGTTSITATVSNDSANGGVTWSCAPSGACGSFNPTSTPSGTATTYTAPGAPATVTVTATSVTDTTKSGSATIAVGSAPITLADGNYVFSMSGSDTGLVGGAFNSPYFVAGVFTVSGGAITAGEQDFVDYNVVATDLIDPTASSFTTTANGNLQITLTTCTGTTCPAPDPSVGVAGVETINATMVSATRARIVEFDAFATSSGALDLQDSIAASVSPLGGYAFSVQGIDGGGNALVVGGVLSLDGTGKLTSSSIFDQNRGGNLSPGETFDTTASSVVGPDSFGRLLVSLKPTDTTLPEVSFAGYIVDAAHIRLAEVADPSGSTTGGTAFGQGTNLAVSGNSYVVGLTGFDANGALHQAATLTLATGVTGTITYNDLSIIQPAISISGGTYVADPTGRVTLTGVTDGVHTFDLQMYIDGNGNALAISMDASDVTQGLGYQQASSPTISGTYVMAATGADFTNEQELDAVGSVTTGSGTFTSISSGVDLNWLNDGITPAQSSVTVSGAFTSTGTGAGNTITGLDVTTPTNADAFDYYVADSTKVIAIENDGNQLTLIYFEQ